MSWFDSMGETLGNAWDTVTGTAESAWDWIAGGDEPADTDPAESADGWFGWLDEWLGDGTVSDPPPATDAPAVPALDTTTLLIGGAVALGAVLLLKRR